MAGSTGGGETIKWLPGKSLPTNFTHMRHLKVSFESGSSVSITKSSAFSIIFWH